MRKMIITIFISLLTLTACVTPPIYAKFADGRLLQGSGVNGNFVIRDVDGYACNGTYPQFKINPSFDIPLTCSDGKTGNIIMSMNAPDFDTGYGQGKLSDGTKFVAIIGNAKDSLSVPNILKPEKPAKIKK